jgi:hypothetical protein
MTYSLLLLSFLPFLFFLNISNKMKPSTKGEKHFVQYLFYSNYTFIWILENFKYFFLALFIYLTRGTYDLTVIAFFLFDLFNFRLYGTTLNHTFESFLDHKLNKFLSKLPDDNNLKSEVSSIWFIEINKHKNFLLLYLDDLIFLFIFVNVVML